MASNVTSSPEKSSSDHDTDGSPADSCFSWSVSSSSSPAKSATPTRRGHVACMKCKQMKKRCDADPKTKAPCSYCKNRERICLLPEPGKSAEDVVEGRVQEMTDRVAELEERLRDLYHTIVADPHPQKLKEALMAV